MRQIRDMSIIEIDITNVCEKRCSNCTRFCGHHKKNFFMDMETFKRAVDSLQGYSGLVSIIGGEPLLHPEFHYFAEYLRLARGEQYIEMNDGRCKAIVKDYLAFAKEERWFEGTINKGKGYSLFTSMPKTYYEYYEDIEDTVTNLWLNDHTNPSFHQPILVSRKDLGISDEQFEVLRDKCWLQNFWSASITPKGVFFCEIAGTLDLLFHGSGGKKIEPGWWNKDIMEYKDQFHWCDICGMALKTYSRNANEEIDDASLTLMKKLKQIDSPKLKNKKVYHFNINNVVKENDSNIGLDMGTLTAKYLSDVKRVGELTDNLKPQNIYLGVTVSSEKDIDKLRMLIDRNKKNVSGFCVVVLPDLIKQCQEMLTKQECYFKVIQVDEIPTTMGGRLNLYVNQLEKQDWVLLGEGDILQTNFAERISQYFLNPGYLFVVESGNDKFVMVSKMALTLKKSGFDRIQRCILCDDIIHCGEEKHVRLDEHF